MLNWLCHFSSHNMPMIESSAASSWLETVMWKQCLQRSWHNLCILKPFLCDTLITTFGLQIFQTLPAFVFGYALLFDIPLNLPKRRENSGCMSPHNWTVTTQTSIHSNRLYLTLIIFTYNIHTHLLATVFEEHCQEDHWAPVHIYDY